MITFFNALILGLVEGITEFLPISSTAHLEITARLMRIMDSNFLKTFEIFIQLGAILAVVVLFAGTLRRSTELWKRIIVAFIPTGIVGFLLYKIIKQYLLGNLTIVAIALIVGGVVMIVLEQKRVVTPSASSLAEIESMPYRTAVIIGLAQSLAVVPGVSRSAATIIAGQSLKLSRSAIVEFSFLLAIPTMLAAAGYDLLKSMPTLQGADYSMLGIGFCVAAIAAFFSIRFFMRFVASHSFVSFGWYRIILGITVLLGIALHLV